MPARWIEITLTLEPELAEPVAELLGRHAPGGVAIESPMIEDDRDEGQLTGPVTVRAYIASDAEASSRRQRIEEGLWVLGRIRALPPATFREVEETDWAERWKDRYRPIRIGRRLVIVPAWLEPPAAPLLPILLDPGMAFGTGAHPSTRLVLAALEDHLLRGASVVDLGCGSGVLSIAACRLGASRVLAIDVDAEAVRATQENTARNGLRAAIEIRQGSLEELLAQGPFDLLMANILASVLEDLLRQNLAGALRPGGIAILSGILDTQMEPVLRVAEAEGFRWMETRSEEDWRALVLKRTPPPGGGGGAW